MAEPAADGRASQAWRSMATLPPTTAMARRHSRRVSRHRGHGGRLFLAQMPEYANAYSLIPHAPGWHRPEWSTTAFRLSARALTGCEVARVVMDAWRYELVCVGVNPGESGHNPALCRFANVRIG